MKQLLSIHIYDTTTQSEFDALIELLQALKAVPADPNPNPNPNPNTKQNENIID